MTTASVSSLRAIFEPVSPTCADKKGSTRWSPVSQITGTRNSPDTLGGSNKAQWKCIDGHWSKTEASPVQDRSAAQPENEMHTNRLSLCKSVRSAPQDTAPPHNEPHDDSATGDQKIARLPPEVVGLSKFDFRNEYKDDDSGCNSMSGDTDSGNSELGLQRKQAKNMLDWVPTDPQNNSLDNEYTEVRRDLKNQNKMYPVAVPASADSEPGNQPPPIPQKQSDHKPTALASITSLNPSLKDNSATNHIDGSGDSYISDSTDNLGSYANLSSGYDDQPIYDDVASESASELGYASIDELGLEGEYDDVASESASELGYASIDELELDGEYDDVASESASELIYTSIEDLELDEKDGGSSSIEATTPSSDILILPPDHDGSHIDFKDEQLYVINDVSPELPPNDVMLGYNIKPRWWTRLKNWITSWFKPEPKPKPDITALLARYNEVPEATPEEMKLTQPKSALNSKPGALGSVFAEMGKSLNESKASRYWSDSLTKLSRSSEKKIKEMRTQKRV